MLSVWEWILLIGSVTSIFAIIIGIFSFFNGRRTRSMLAKLLRESNKETQSLIKGIQNMIKEMHESSLKSNEEIKNLIIESTKDTQSLIKEIHEDRKIFINEIKNIREDTQNIMKEIINMRKDTQNLILETHKETRALIKS